MSRPDPVQALFDRFAVEGPTRYALWDSELYDECLRMAGGFRYRLREDPGRDAFVAAWLRMVSEGIGAGRIYNVIDERGAWDWLPEQGLLSWCLFRILPRTAHQLDPAERLALLARAWNLCEGLSREPEWVRRYVVARAKDELRSLRDLQTFLVGALQPVLSEPPPARWVGPFDVQVLDARKVHPSFLPGEMYMAAPSVICVTDRRTPDLCTAIFLERGGKSRLVGRTGRLPRRDPEEPPPIPIPGERSLRVAGREVALPHLSVPYSCAAAGAGFVATTAVDSQRIWLVETP